ncbi:MAG: hypothetical protein HYX54_03435 [Chloroflexi bacterium]|nr:hypothetical protein [Chloroflexota bacterium]
MGRFVRPEAGVTDLPDATPLRLVDAVDRIVGIGVRDGRRIAPTKMLAGARGESNASAIEDSVSDTPGG